MNDIFLSLIVPAYKQEKTIVENIRVLESILLTIVKKHEIVVVVDGFVDNTLGELKKIKYPNLKIVGYKDNKGKGFAVKAGVEEAQGEIIGFLDAGMDLDPTEISMMLNIMKWNDADIVIGSKLHPDSIVNYPWSRKILSWGYRMIIKLLFSLNVKDTQVGLKLFRKKVAKNVFPKIVVKAFAFDIEVLAVAKMLGYGKIFEAPIRLRFKQGSVTSTNFWKISLWTLWDTLAVFYRMNILNYYK